mgnify:CR=1 FL=1
MFQTQLIKKKIDLKILYLVIVRTMDITKMLKDANEDRVKKLSDNSIKVYNSNLKILNKLITNEDSIKNIDFIKDIDKVYDVLSEKSIHTKKNYTTAIIVLLKILKEEELYKQYARIQDKLSNKIEDNYDENSKTETQKENWVDYKEVLDLLNKYKRDAKPILKKDKNDLTKKDLQLIQQYLVLYLYSGKAFDIIRNDFANMKIVDDEKDLETDKNYLVIPKKRKTPYFHLGEYKTKKSKTNDNEPFIIPLKDTDLNNLIRIWITINDSEYLLINLSGNQNTEKGSPMTANGITKYLQKIFKNNLGKSISTSLLRSIYITHKYKQNLNTKQKKELATNMLHSKPMAEQVYNKIVV